MRIIIKVKMILNVKTLSLRISLIPFWCINNIFLRNNCSSFAIFNVNNKFFFFIILLLNLTAILIIFHISNTAINIHISFRLVLLFLLHLCQKLHINLHLFSFNHRVFFTPDHLNDCLLIFIICNIIC